MRRHGQRCPVRLLCYLGDVCLFVNVALFFTLLDDFTALDEDVYLIVLLPGMERLKSIFSTRASACAPTAVRHVFPHQVSFAVG